jgi:Flp pilus assembly pilin Flp
MPAANRNDQGQGLIEFVLILALIAIVALSAILFLGGGLDTILSTIHSGATASPKP